MADESAPKGDIFQDKVAMVAVATLRRLGYSADDVKYAMTWLDFHEPDGDKKDDR